MEHSVQQIDYYCENNLLYLNHNGNIRSLPNDSIDKCQELQEFKEEQIDLH